MSLQTIATEGFLPPSLDGIATEGFLVGDLAEALPGGGYKGPLFDIRDLTYLYEPQEPVTEVIEKEGKEADLEYQPPEILVPGIPSEYRAKPISQIEDVTEREIAALLREIEIKKHARRIIEEAEKQALYKKNLSVMIALMLDEL